VDGDLYTINVDPIHHREFQNNISRQSVYQINIANSRRFGSWWIQRLWKLAVVHRSVHREIYIKDVRMRI